MKKNSPEEIHRLQLKLVDLFNSEVEVKTIAGHQYNGMLQGFNSSTSNWSDYSLTIYNSLKHNSTKILLEDIDSLEPS